jgi:NRAMP (natural resistance-associated macrophage protein)-like metal ion transporter
VLVILITCAVALGQVNPPPALVFKGFFPSREIFVSDGLYSSCTMAGGMLMPHALYVGSSIAQPRLLDYGTKYHITTYHQGQTPINIFYSPSLRAVNSIVRYATWDLCLSIFVIGLFVNSALEIISGVAFAQDETLPTCTACTISSRQGLTSSQPPCLLSPPYKHNLSKTTRTLAHNLTLAHQLSIKFATVKGQVDVEVHAIKGPLRCVHAFEVFFEVLPGKI